MLKKLYRENQKYNSLKNRLLLKNNIVLKKCELQQN